MRWNCTPKWSGIFLKLSFPYIDVSQLTFIWCELGKFIYMLDCVLAVGNTEAELKVEALEQAVAEEVALDHAELADGFVTYCKLHPETEKNIFRFLGFFSSTDTTTNNNNNFYLSALRQSCSCGRDCLLLLFWRNIMSFYNPSPRCLANA